MSEVKNIFEQERIMLQVTFKSGLTLSGFQTTPPRDWNCQVTFNLVPRAGGVKWSVTAVGWSMCCFAMAFSIARLCSTNLSLRWRLVLPKYWTLHLLHCIMTLQARAPPASGAFRCHRNRCRMCPFITEGTTSYTFLHTNEQRCIRHYITCPSSNLVYMMQCNKRNVQYIDEIKRD